jgi:hypothetical protein
MELKSAEREVDELEDLYERIRGYDRSLSDAILPPLRDRPEDDATAVVALSQPGSAATETATTPTAAVSSKGEENDGNGGGGSNGLDFSSASNVLLSAELLRVRVEELAGAASKLDKRRDEADPVTGRPRYGDRTLARVDNVLRRYGNLRDVVNLLFPAAATPESSRGDLSNGDGEPPGRNSASTNGFVGAIQLAAQREEDEDRRREEIEQERRQRQEEERLAQERVAAEQERRRQEAAALEEEMRVAERARQAEAARQAVRQARDEADRADRMWLESINRGVDGVRHQLSVLLESAAKSDDDDDGNSNPVAVQRNAVTALHALFSQIVAHPEEPKYRRVRRDHAKFNADIGRFKGGKEILVAAGFELGAIDDVPCFLSKEPDIEKDMDGWASWYDLLKATLAVLEEELLKL